MADTLTASDLYVWALAASIFATIAALGWAICKLGGRDE